MNLQDHKTELKPGDVINIPEGIDLMRITRKQLELVVSIIKVGKSKSIGMYCGNQSSLKIAKTLKKAGYNITIGNFTNRTNPECFGYGPKWYIIDEASEVSEEMVERLKELKNTSRFKIFCTGNWDDIQEKYNE